MSTQPTPMPRPKTAEQKQKREERIADLTYFSGAAAIAIGLGFFHPRPAFGLIGAGVFVALPPALDLVSAFIRGLSRRN